MGFGAIEAYGAYADKNLSQSEKKSAYANAAAGTTGSVIGGVVGGGIGALFGGVGAVPGAMVGAALGDMIGRALAEHSQNQPVVVESKLVVSGQVLATAVNSQNSRQATRY